MEKNRKIYIDKQTRSRIKVFKTFEDIYKTSPSIDAMMISFGCFYKRSRKTLMKFIGVENIENQLLDIKDHLGLLSSTDKLNMLKPDATIKKDEFTGKYMESNWIVYMLECNDKSIYTGICKGDLGKRMKEHRDGKGSKYVRSRLPFQLMWSKGGFTASESLKEEYRIKQLSPEDKRKIWNEEI